MTARPGPAVLVGVTGSIAAFRTCDLVSRLSKEGFRVTVLMTRAARRFVTPLTFETLSHHKVVTSLWTPQTDDPEHVALAREAACYAITPATANCLAKLALGLADDAVTTTALAARCPLIVAPAMNSRMWEHPAVTTNLATLRSRGTVIVKPEEGILACGTFGPGKLASSDTLYAAIVKAAGAPKKLSAALSEHSKKV